MSYKYLGLLSIVLLLGGLWFVIWEWPQGKHMTFSQHAAQHKTATICYCLLFAVTLPLLNIFFIKWFTPTFDLPGWFNVFAVTASVFQVACTLVPEVYGWQTKLHQVLAGISALLLLPLMIILANSSDISRPDRCLAAIALLVMLSVITFAAHTKGRHAKLLIFQAAYFLAFFTPILSISYL